MTPDKDIGVTGDKSMTTVSLAGSWVLTHLAAAQSSSQFVDAERLQSNPEGRI